MYYLIHMTFRLSTKSQTFAIQQLLYWYIKCKNGSSKTSISILYTFFFPRGFLPHLYHLFSSLLEHLTLLFSLPPILNGLFLDLLLSVLDFKGMQQLIWAGSYICKKKPKPILNYFTSFFFTIDSPTQPYQTSLTEPDFVHPALKNRKLQDLELLRKYFLKHLVYK